MAALAFCRASHFGGKKLTTGQFKKQITHFAPSKRKDGEKEN